MPRICLTNVGYCASLPGWRCSAGRNGAWRMLQRGTQIGWLGSSGTAFCVAGISSTGAAQPQLSKAAVSSVSRSFLTERTEELRNVAQTAGLAVCGSVLCPGRDGARRAQRNTGRKEKPRTSKPEARATLAEPTEENSCQGSRNSRRCHASRLQGRIARMRQKDVNFEKRTGEVVENKGKFPKNEPERS